jgi:hypothetical protein
MIITLSTNNIIANLNQSIIVTIVNSWLTFDFVIDFWFAFRKNVLYVINITVDRRIIQKRNARISKNALRLVIWYQNRVKDLNIVWNNLSLNSKTIKMKILSLSSSKNWTSRSRSRSTISRLMNSSLNSTANQNHFSSLSIRLMIRRHFLQSLSCSLTRHLNTDWSWWIASLFLRIQYRTSIMSLLRQDTTIASSKKYWSITTQQIFRQRILNNSRLYSESAKRHWFWIRKESFLSRSTLMKFYLST